MKTPRSVEAATIPLTGAVGLQTNKARSLFAGEQRDSRAVVSRFKATGVSGGTRAPVISLTHPGKRTRQSAQILLSPRPPGRST
jgi:hypothetical protein